jgi:phospholipid-binding lipoprotein MlaA
MPITAARSATFCLIIAGLAGCAANPAKHPASPHDPLQGFNRGVFKFNDALDRGVAKPVAKAYRAVTPQPVRTGIGNFIANLRMPLTLVNDLLQGKVRAAWSDTGRLLLNTTMGIGGLFDVATKAGIDHNDEDFGQTLGAWGVPAGPFLMIPFLGPSDMRDAPTRVADAFANPATYANVEARWGYRALDLVNTRYELLPLDATLDKAYDKYAFMRDAYLQNRAFKVSDGNVPEETLEDPEAMDAPEESPPPK